MNQCRSVLDWQVVPGTIPTSISGCDVCHYLSSSTSHLPEGGGRKEPLMYLVKDVGKVLIEYSLDEPIPGRHPRCVVCGKLLLAEDEIIVLRRDKVTGQGVREGLFFCALCANETVNTIKSLLGE